MLIIRVEDRGALKNIECISIPIITPKDSEPRSLTSIYLIILWIMNKNPKITYMKKITEKEDLEILITDAYCYTSEHLDEYLSSLRKHNKFLEERIFPNYGKFRKNCPPEFMEEYEPIKINFIKTIESIQRDFIKLKIDRTRILKLIKYCKKENEILKEGLLDILQCIEQSTREYQYRYHAHFCKDLVDSIINSKSSFISLSNYVYSKERQLQH
jgi:hypothetical protein